MAKKLLNDYLVMEKEKSLAIVCEKHLVEGVDFSETELIINKQGLEEGFIFISNRTQTDAVKVSGLQKTMIKTMFENGFIYLLLVDGDEIYKSYQIDKIK